jgi:uncharacterized membrane protein YjjP (DUF1212 family)
VARAPSSGASGDTGERRQRELLEFLLYLGSALTAAGEAVNRIEERLRLVATAYGASRLRVSVLPTYLVIAPEPGRPATLEPTRALRGTLRLDQTATLFHVVKAAERGEMRPADGIRRILAIVDSRPRFRPIVMVLGHLVLTAGICALLEPTWGDLALAALFGVLVGLLKLVGARWASLEMIMPVCAAFAVAASTFLIAGWGWADADLRAMVAPLVTFLPGATLTMAVVELSAGQMVTGASRLVTGALQLLLLAFGIIGAAHVVGLSAGDFVSSAGRPLGAWAAPLGVFVVGVGSYLYHCAPPRSLGWLCLVLYAGWLGQYLGSQIFGGYLSGFAGAVVMTPVAYLVERLPSGPPALVSFLPAFWMLVPGALSLMGITEYLGHDALSGLQDLAGALGSMIAIALGVLCGYPLYRSLDPGG